MDTMHPARWYDTAESGLVRCILCPHNCLLKDGKTGNCRVRTAKDGKLYTEVYGRLSAIHLDPIEKKPLYHFFPGRRILSLGSVGCNLHCKFCQNCEISQVGVKDARFLEDVSADQILAKTEVTGSFGIAYTYNEPVVWFEFVMDVATRAKEAGIRNVMVTNGFINPDPLDELIEVIDAFSVDLKAFDNTFYHDQTASSLQPVLASLKKIAGAGRHLEIVNLLIPGLNDDPAAFEDMVKWISSELGRNTVLHLSAYFPRYRSTAPPTPPAMLTSFREIASAYLDFVYAGNLPGERNDTLCPSCRNLLVSRTGYEVNFRGVTQNGCCKQCGQTVFQNF